MVPGEGGSVALELQKLPGAPFEKLERDSHPRAAGEEATQVTFLKKDMDLGQGEGWAQPLVLGPPLALPPHHKVSSTLWRVQGLQLGSANLPP